MREGTAVLLYLAWILRPKMPVVLNHFPDRLGVPSLTCEWRIIWLLREDSQSGLIVHLNSETTVV